MNRCSVDVLKFVVLQKVVFYNVKDGLLPPERSSFGMQNTVFCNVACNRLSVNGLLARLKLFADCLRKGGGAVIIMPFNYIYIALLPSVGGNG